MGYQEIKTERRRKMKKILFLCLFLCLTLPKGILAAPIEDDLEYGGYLKSEFWVRNNTDSRHQFLSSFKNTVDLAIEHKISDNWIFFVHPRYFYDAAYSIRESIFDKNQEKMGNTQRTDWLRDCYLDYTSDQLDIRIGKQQVVWGQADGLPFLDRVMPFDLSYYWLPDFADIRIPLWMLKVEYSPKVDSTLQFLLMPDFEASRSAPAYAPFAFSANNAFEDFKKTYPATTSIHRPASQFKNSRVGLRWRSIMGSTEYTLNWLYGYNPSAQTYSEGGLSFSRKHKILQLIGFSFNRTVVEHCLFEGWTLRGEFTYVHNEPTYYGLDGSRKRTQKTDKYAYVLGFDKNFFRNYSFSFQFAQYITDDRTWDGFNVLNGYTYGAADKIENVVTCKISTDFMYERLKPEVLIICTDDGDGRVSFKTKYEAKDNLWFTLGYHHFWGPPNTSNGQYRNNDHILFEIKRTF